MSSNNTIFPEKFLSDYHKMSEEDQLSLSNPETTIFKGDD